MWADDAVGAAVAAAADHGLVVDGARLVRADENGVVVLPAAGALARVVRDRSRLGQVRHEISVAGWLSSVGVPVARPLVSEPAVAAGYVVSFWEYLADATSADLVTLGRCLRQLHSVPVPEGSLLRRVEPFSRFDVRLAAAATLGQADRIFLRELRDRLAGQWEQATFDLGEAVLHGDAHMDNLLDGEELACNAICLVAVTSDSQFRSPMGPAGERGGPVGRR